MISLRQLIQEAEWSIGPYDPTGKAMSRQLGSIDKDTGKEKDPFVVTPDDDKNKKKEFTKTQKIFIGRINFIAEAMKTKHHFAHDPWTVDPDAQKEKEAERTVIDKLAAWISKFPSRGMDYPLQIGNGEDYKNPITGKTEQFIISNTRGAMFTIRVKEEGGQFQPFIVFRVSQDPNSFDVVSSYLNTLRSRAPAGIYNSVKDEISDIDKSSIGNSEDTIAGGFAALQKARIDTYAQLRQKGEKEQPKPDTSQQAAQASPTSNLSAWQKAWMLKKGIPGLKENSFKHLSQMLY